MPLLPGETREKDVYTSGLSFIDSAGKQLKSWANQTQESIERTWSGLTAVASDARPGVSNDVALGPMVPSRLYLNEEAILLMMSRAALTVIIFDLCLLLLKVSAPPTRPVACLSRAHRLSPGRPRHCGQGRPASALPRHGPPRDHPGSGERALKGPRKVERRLALLAACVIVLIIAILRESAPPRTAPLCPAALLFLSSCASTAAHYSASSPACARAYAC
jgi:hypothetical protein